MNDLSLGEIQELADAAGFDWEGREQASVIEVLGPTGTYEDLPEWRQCDLIDALEADAIDYLQSKEVPHVV